MEDIHALEEVTLVPYIKHSEIMRQTCLTYSESGIYNFIVEMTFGFVFLI